MDLFVGVMITVLLAIICQLLTRIRDELYGLRTEVSKIELTILTTASETRDKVDGLYSQLLDVGLINSNAEIVANRLDEISDLIRDYVDKKSRE